MRFLVLIFLLLLPVPAQAMQNNFRNFIWGATPDDVMKFETAKYYKTENGSLYFVELPGENDFRRVIRYDFQDNKLWRGSYEYQELEDANPRAILDRYEDLKVELEKQYGGVTDELFIWKNKMYRDHPEFWGRALLAKDLKVRSEWELPDTRVVLDVFFIDPDFNLSYTVTRTSVSEKKEKENLLSVPLIRPDAPAQP